MKKSILKVGAIAMAGTMALGLVACGGKKDPNPNNPNNPNVNLSLYEMADVLARGVDAHYVTRNDEEVAFGFYYNALEGGLDGYANNYEGAALIGMANRMYDVSEGENKEYYKKLLDDYISALDYYDGAGWITSTHGKRYWEHLYGVTRAREPYKAAVEGRSMVYDDLMWIARYFIEGYRYSGYTETSYLEKAEHLIKCCLDGWDSTQDGAGGITWGPAYSTKHACSNGPILSVLGGLAEVYKGKDDALVTEDDTVYVAQTFGQGNVEWENWVGKTKYEYYSYWLETIYDWCWTNLRAGDYTYIDLRGDSSSVVSDEKAPGNEYLKFAGNLDSGSATKYTYNTGSVLSGAAWLYRLTGKEQYLTQGRQMAEGAFHRFVKTVKAQDGTEHQMYECTASLLFNSVLLQGYAELADAIKVVAADKDETVKEELNNIIKNELNTYVGVFKSSITYGFQNHLLNRTLPQNYIQGWLYGNETMDTKKESKDASATPEMLAIIVQYEKAHGEIK